ncbi:hypothetical protein JCM10449v2_006002 [Rhodotorula kratochvilovae]
MSSASRNRKGRVFAEEDEVLSSRLRALGYSLDRPAPPASPGAADGSSDEDEPEGPPVKNTLQLFVDQVEETIARMKRVKDGDPLEDFEVKASSPISFDDSSREASPSPTTPSSPRAPSLADLLRLVDEHKSKAVKAKQEKERKKRHKKDPPPVTPRQESAMKLDGLRLNSTPAAMPTSPQKRRRRPSTPSTPCPRDVLTTPTRSARVSASSSSSSDGSPSPTKRVARHLPHVLTLLSLSLRLVGATNSPLVSSASRLDELMPGVTLAQLVDLAHSLREGAPLLSLAHERTKAGGRTFDSNLNFVGDHLFSASPKKLSDPQRATLFLAKELQLYPPPLAAPVAPPLPRILSTRRSTCAQCDSPLNLYKRPSRPVYLVEPASPASLVLIASHICTNSACRALHTPDHVEISYGSNKVWLWEKEPEALKVGDRVYVSNGFARHYRMLLLEQATSAGAFASFWNQLYRADTPDISLEADDDDSGGEDSSSGDDEGEQPEITASPALILRQKHVWRAFVVYSSILAASALSHGRLASLARPLTEHVVALANSDIFGTAQGAASVLPPHSCSTCTRQPRVWRRGPATAEERARGVRWTGTHAKEGPRYFEDTKVVSGPDVQLAVCDGIQIGHPLCAAPSCPNPPDAIRRSRRFCSTHINLHLICGVIGCTRERSNDGVDDDAPSEACDLPAHEALWQAYTARRRRLEERGWTGRRFAPPRKYALPDIDEVELDDSSSLQLYSDDDEEDVASGNGGGKEKPSAGTTDGAHTWRLRRTSNLQILVGACGAPLAWTKFAEGETAAEVLTFLASVHKQVASHFPTYIAYDRACHVLRDVLSSADAAKTASLPPFLSSSRLIVTAFHKRGHPADDAFCDEFCTPTPLDGQAQDLVIPFRRLTKKGKYKKGEPRTFERAFNTSAAEQLNSTISRFAPLLSTLRADNFDFLVHVLLRHRKAAVWRKAAA